MATRKPPSESESGGSSGAIPVLSEVVSLRKATGPALSPERVAALQTELVAQTLKTAEELLHAAAREMEATLLERVADQLRARLPEIVDRVLRERLSQRDDPRPRDRDR